jgi:hypothetical protein
MVAEIDCCTCAACGARCTGLFLGCAEVWARRSPTDATGDGAKSTTNGTSNGANGTNNGASGKRGTNGAPVLVPEPVTWGPTAGHPERFDPLHANPAAPAITPIATATDLGIDWDAPPATHAPAPAPPAPAYAPLQPRRRLSTKAIVAIGVAAVLALAGVAVALGSSGGSDAGGISTPVVDASDLTFDPFTVVPGVTGTRRWELRGSDGQQFLGSITFANTTGAPVAMTYDETIPKTLARNVSVILFDPSPTVVRADPVVRYAFTLEAGASTTVRYRIVVPPEGKDRSRLERWARDVETEIAQRIEAAREAAANALTPEELAAAQAALLAALNAQDSFSPRRTTRGGGGDGSGEVVDPAPTDPAPTDPTVVDPPTDPSTTPTSEEPTTTPSSEEPTTTPSSEEPTTVAT